MTTKKLVPESLNEAMSPAQVARMDAEREGKRRYAFDTEHEGPYFDPKSTQGDLAAVGVGGRYREDSEGEVQVSQAQVDIAWAFVEKKQELLDRAIAEKMPPAVIAKREKFLEDAIAKAESLEEQL